MEKHTELPDIQEIRNAHKRIESFINRTPVHSSGAVNKHTGSKLFFKCENFQKVGAFKFRGACNATLQLINKHKNIKAVGTHSSGNHAQALALAAKINGLQAYVVMPENSPKAKVEAVKEYGANITFCKPSLEAREQTMEQVLKETGASFIHPYNHYDIIAGQGSSMLELSEEMPPPACIIAPVGGGGLLSGTSIAAKALFPTVKVYGAEPLGADDAYRSFHEKKMLPSVNPGTMADGLLTALGTLTYKAITEHVDDILRVKEDSIVLAMQLIWERMKLVVEPSGCVPLAAILEYPDLFKGKNTGVILSGGNLDLSLLFQSFLKPQLIGK